MKYKRHRRLASVAGLLLLGVGTAVVFRGAPNPENVSLTIIGSDFREHKYSGDMEAHLRLRIRNSSSATIQFHISCLETNGPSGWVPDEAQITAGRYLRVHGRSTAIKEVVIPGVPDTWRVRAQVYARPSLFQKLGWAGKRLVQGTSWFSIKESWPFLDLWLVDQSKPVFELVSNPRPRFADPPKPPTRAPVPDGP